MTKPGLPNLQQSVANAILITNISNNNNLNKFWVGIGLPKFTKRELGSQWVSEWQALPMIGLGSDKKSMLWKYKVEEGRRRNAWHQTSPPPFWQARFILPLSLHLLQYQKIPTSFCSALKVSVNRKHKYWFCICILYSRSSCPTCR